MTIEIGGVSGKPIQESGDKNNVSATHNSSQKTPAKSSGSGGGDTVSLTSSATQLRELETRISDLPVVDVQRVSDVQRALATGTLELSEADAATNLIEIEKSFSQ
jgi:negative regulator of flagellin synthesis FlgM